MRWRKPPKPKTGDVQTVIKFAWAPVELSNGETCWLEKYKQEQCYLYEPIVTGESMWIPQANHPLYTPDQIFDNKLDKLLDD